jgi:hypothetical protein
MSHSWIEFISVATNISILIVGIKLVRHMSRMELKVEMMWDVFMHKFRLDKE